jgi:hypothetical protein
MSFSAKSSGRSAVGLGLAVACTALACGGLIVIPAAVSAEPNVAHHSASTEGGTTAPRPVGHTDHATTTHGNRVVIKPLANDTAPKGDHLKLFHLTEGHHGDTLADIHGAVAYTPDSRYAGKDTFYYRPYYSTPQRNVVAGNRTAVKVIVRK